MIYLDPSQLWNCLAQFHGVIYKDSSAESSCIFRSFLFPPPSWSRSQPWELFCSSRYFLSLWSISHGLTSHFCEERLSKDLESTLKCICLDSTPAVSTPPHRGLFWVASHLSFSRSLGSDSSLCLSATSLAADPVLHHHPTGQWGPLTSLLGSI